MTINAFNVAREDPAVAASRIAAEVRGRIDGTNKTDKDEGADADGGLFETALDTINPLQHIPGVSSIYRATSGDEINPLASMAGGFLFGGPLGLGISAASSFIEVLTGKSPAEHAMALLEGVDDNSANKNMVASVGQDPKSNEALVGSVDQRAQADANVLADAKATRRPGFGATQSTVEYSSNIWTQSAIMGVTDKYDSAEKLNDRPGPGSKDSGATA